MRLARGARALTSTVIFEPKPGVKPGFVYLRVGLCPAGNTMRSAFVPQRHSTSPFNFRSVDHSKAKAISWTFLLALFVWLAGPGDAAAANVPVGFAETIIPGPSGGNWDEAVGVTFSPNGRMWVLERAGRVWLKDTNDSTFTLLLNISEEVGDWGDHGCVGFAIHPDFQVNGYIYILYAVDRHHLLNFGTPGYNPNQNQYDNATIGRLTRYTCNSANGFRSIVSGSRFVMIGETRQTGII